MMQLSVVRIFFIFNIALVHSQNLKNYSNDYFSSNGESLSQWFTFGSHRNENTNKIVKSFYGSSSNGCDQYFSYRNDFNGQTFGLVSISNPDRQRNIVKTILTVAARLPSGDFGEISLFSSKEDSLYAVKQRLPLQLKIRFPVQRPLPKIHEVYLNDRLLCSVPKEMASYVTTMTLYFTFTTNLLGPAPEYPNWRPQPPQPLPETQRPYQPPPTYPPYQPPATQSTQIYTYQETIPHRTTQQPTTRTYPTTEAANPPSNIDVRSNLDYINSVCGVSEFKESVGFGLVKGGLDAGRGQFPWLVAYFYSSKYTNDFICGGSLISQKIVITAAHCIHNKDDAEVRKPEASTFYFGKNNLDSLIGEKGYILSTALYLYVHPEWDTGETLFSNDIAIAVLQRSIMFNYFVKPICIWRNTQSYKDMIGKEGTIAGWGKTDFHSISTSTAIFVKLPVVSNEDCLRSDVRFFSILSEKSFCAGIRNSDKGPCNGDSGGAFIAEESGKSYLRGIVSSAIFDETTLTCDNNDYAVFTDVSQFTVWIEGFMDRYG